MEILKSRIQRKAERVVHLLTKHKLELATMESCTGGGLAHALTTVNGAGSVYQGGFITYSSFAKNNAGIPIEALNTKDGPYTPAVAELMARTALKDPFHPLPQNDSVIGVGITGTLETTDMFYPHIKPGSIWIGIKQDGHSKVHYISIRRRRREAMKREVIRRTLDLIQKTMEPRPQPTGLRGWIGRRRD